MRSLFIDTSEKLCLGLLDENYQWVDYDSTELKRSAGSLHQRIYELLEKNDLNLKQVDRLFCLSGPGSYTGIRISESMAQIWNWQGIETYSFYHFEVPGLCGIEQGTWFSFAFKGELFYTTWEGNEYNYQFVDVDNEGGIEQIDKSFLFTHFVTDYIPESLKADSLQLTSDIIFKQAPEVFSKVTEQKLRRSPYYYRPLDVEFRPPRLR